MLQTSSNQHDSNHLARTPVTNVVNLRPKTLIFGEKAIGLTTFVTTRTRAPQRLNTRDPHDAPRKQRARLRCPWAVAGPGRASRSTTPSEARVWRSRGRPGPTAPRTPAAPGTPAAPQATKTPEPEAVPGSGGGGWGIRTPEGLHPTRFPSVRHRPLGESSVHIVPDNHKR